MKYFRGIFLVAAIMIARNVNAWDSSITPCQNPLCGNHPQNVATMGVSYGTFKVSDAGAVSVDLSGLHDHSGSTLGFKELEVFFGTFRSGSFGGVPIGSIVTDERGDYKGPVLSGGIQPYFMTQQAGIGQFILNDPSVRSEFITTQEYSVKSGYPVPR